jgi:hypothetical protein
VTLVQRFAVWLYQRPRLRRAFKATCALWFGTAWAVVGAPTAAAYVTPGTQPSPLYVGGQDIMDWAGLVDNYGVPVSHYYLSVVSPVDAAANVFGQQIQGISGINPVEWIGQALGAILAGIVTAFSGILVAIPLNIEVIILLAIGIIGIWFLEFTLSAPWLSWLATMAQPVVATLQQMVREFYVMPLGLLVATGYGGVIALTKGRGRGMGIIFGSYMIILAYYLFFSAPTEEVFGDNGVLGIGQHLGFIVAEGVVNNGALTAGNGAAQLGSLISLLCTTLLREQIQILNFGDVIDNINGCAGLWNAAIMTGNPFGPADAMQSCDPAAFYYAATLSPVSIAWALVLIVIEFIIMLCLIYIGFHVVAIGFRSFFNLLTLVVAVPLAVAPGPTRRYAGRQVHRGIRDGLAMFAATGGLAVVAILIGSILSGAPGG